MSTSPDLARTRALPAGLAPFLPYIAISLVHCTLVAFQLPGSGYETKQLLMPALALAVILSLRNARPWPKAAALLLFAATLFSWIGDGAGLFFPGLPTLPMMIAFFALAHLAYIWLFWRTPGMGIGGIGGGQLRAKLRALPKWTVVYAIWWVTLLAIVGPHAGALFVPLAVYGIVLGGTAVLSTRLGGLVALGGASFLFSDSVIALREFVGIPGWIGDALIMPTYVLGQGLIVYGALRHLRSRGEGQARLQ